MTRKAIRSISPKSWETRCNCWEESPTMGTEIRGVDMALAPVPVEAALRLPREHSRPRDKHPHKDKHRHKDKRLHRDKHPLRDRHPQKMTQGIFAVTHGQTRGCAGTTGSIHRYILADTKHFHPVGKCRRFQPQQFGCTVISPDPPVDVPQSSNHVRFFQLTNFCISNEV